MRNFLVFLGVLFCFASSLAAKNELYFYRFKLNFSDELYSHLNETLPGILAIKLDMAGLSSRCSFLDKSKGLDQFNGYLINGKMIKDSGGTFELKIFIQHKQTGKRLKHIYFKGRTKKLWAETTNLAFLIAKRLKFYVDPEDKKRMEQLNISSTGFKYYLQALREEKELRFESAANLYQSVLDEEQSFFLAEKKRLYCLYRYQADEFDSFANAMLKKEDDDPDVLYLKIRQDYQEGETFKAKHWLRRALDKSPRHVETRITQACIQVLEKDYFTANVNMKALFIYDEHLSAIYFVELLNTPKMGEDEESQEHIAKLFSKGMRFLTNEDPWLLHLGAKALIKHNLKEQAKKLLERASKPALRSGYFSFIKKELRRLK